MRYINYITACAALVFTIGAGVTTLSAQTDTLRVMAYNVLNYGEYPLCQGPNGFYHAYLDTIVTYANPDIISLEKMGSNYTWAANFQDSILQFALNAAYPGRYNYCTYTNNAGNNTFSMLFYNQRKLGFIGISCNYPNDEDVNTYKLYYKDPALSTIHDTTFLYVTVNHDISGSGSAATRGAQIAGEMAQIQSRFSHLANMINMGDFNVRNSYEPLYKTLTSPADSNFLYYDPPFYPDANFGYPANWDTDPATYAKYLTTSTRALGDVPNTCGTNGGAKDWFDHIFLSPWIINNTNYISYIPHSFRVIGNDGNRIGISVNDAPANTSAPISVINSLFQMSNKYPVMVDLAVTSNTTGVSPLDPEGHSEAVVNQMLPDESVTFTNPVSDNFNFYFSNSLIGKTYQIVCVDMPGREVFSQYVTTDKPNMQLSCHIQPGVYILKIVCNNIEIFKKIFIKS